VTTRIFLSYRHDGDAAVRKQICDTLKAHFGNDSVVSDEIFTDGVDLELQVKDAISRCAAVLVLVDPHWIASMPRICEPKDFVRVEIAHAVRARMPVIPVLVDATMPSRESMPPEIADFARYTGRAVDMIDGFPTAMQRLVRSVTRIQEGEEWASSVYEGVYGHAGQDRWEEARALLESALETEQATDGGWRKFNRVFPMLRELHDVFAALETASIAFRAGCFEHVKFVLEDAAARNDAARRAMIVANIGVAAATALHRNDRDALDAQQMRLDAVCRTAGARSVIPGVRDVATFITEARANLASRAALELRAAALYKAAVHRYDYERDEIVSVKSLTTSTVLNLVKESSLRYEMPHLVAEPFVKDRWLRSLVDGADRKMIRSVMSFPTSDLSELCFSISAPAVIKRRAPIPVTLWAHSANERGLEVGAAASGGVESLLTARLHLRDLQLEAERPMLWQGTFVRADFAVQCPAVATRGTARAAVEVFADGLRIATVRFSLRVGSELGAVAFVETTESRYRTAFASYVEADRDDVQSRLRQLRELAPGLVINEQCLALRRHPAWEQEMTRVLARHESFYLFWSTAAGRSPHVASEWRCALARGSEFISGILLDAERTPPELHDVPFFPWVPGRAYEQRGKAS